MELIGFRGYDYDIELLRFNSGFYGPGENMDKFRFPRTSSLTKKLFQTEMLGTKE